MKCLIYIFALFLAETHAQTIGFGGCPTTAIKANFDTAQFGGKWYIQHKMFDAYELTGICQTANITFAGNNVTVINKQLDAFAFGDKFLTGNGSIVSNGKISINYPGYPVPMVYTVIDTDYTKFASVAVCIDFFLVNIKYAWVLTREKLPASTITDQALSIFNANSYPSSAFNKTEQFWCLFN